MFATNSTRMKRTLQNDEVQSRETEQPKLEVPADHQSDQKPGNETHDGRSEQPLQISRIGTDNETNREENDIEEVDTQQEELSSSVSSSSEDFTSTSDASIPVEQQQEDEIEQIARKAVDEATIRQYPSRYYYHYTPLYKLNKIRKDGYLFAAKPRYVRMKKGIYVTTMPPFCRTGWELRKCAFKGGSSLKTRRKLESYVALDKNDVSRTCSKVEELIGRPKCLRLVPKNNLYLKEVEHYCGPRSATGQSDTESD